MLTLPDAIVAVLLPFATLFQNRTWLKAQVLLVGAILTPGQRTVAAALRVMGLSGDRNYARYHHVLNRARAQPGGLIPAAGFAGPTKPESTDGRPWGQPLKQPEGAPLNLG